MASRYDIEDLLGDILALLQSKLNARIASIEAEKIAAGKPDTGLKPIDSSAYFEQSWSDKMLNITPAIFYGIEEDESVGAGPATVQTVTLWVDVVIVDSGMDNLTKNRILRYSRALREIFEENWDAFIGNASKIKIKTVRPIDFKMELNTSETIKVGGVSIVTALG